jgi:hypothetical protein
MFNRIRYAARVLSNHPVNPYEQPDIAFEEEKPVEVTRVSRAVGSLIEVAVLSVVIGLVAAPFLVRIWRTWTVHPWADVDHITAVIAAVLAILSSQLIERCKQAIGSHLKIGDRVAPYFGHKITSTIRTLRG